MGVDHMSGHLKGLVGWPGWTCPLCYSLQGLSWVQVLTIGVVHPRSANTLRYKQEDQKFMIILDYLVLLRLAWTT